MKRPAPDWLIDPSPYRAVVAKDDATGDIVLDNGLVRRRIRTRQGCATVSYEELVADRQLLRSTRPEASLVVEGVALDIGGLTGQRIHNFLDPETEASLAPTPSAYALDRVRFGATSERFPWRQRPEWMARTAVWPPPGCSLTLSFTPPASPPVQRGALLLDDPFTSRSAAWSITESDAHPRVSFTNEGKFGEIMAPDGLMAYAERALPDGAREIELVLDVGDDVDSAEWGPGLALGAGDRTLVAVTARADIQRFDVRGPDGTGTTEGSFLRDFPMTLRVTLDAGTVTVAVAVDRGAPTEIASYPLRELPTLVRIGRFGPAQHPVDAIDAAPDPDRLPPRVHLRSFEVRGPAEPAALSRLPDVDVRYELYDGIPLISKWVVVRNPGPDPITLDRITVESLALVETESRPSALSPGRVRPYPWLHVESDFACGGDGRVIAADRGVSWVADAGFDTQVDYDRATECLLDCTPENGPAVLIDPGDEFVSYRVFELAYDSLDRDRNSLALRRMYRTIAPWTTANPLQLHTTDSSDAGVRLAIDQAADAGFDLVVLSFGSDFVFEEVDGEEIARLRRLSDYARECGVALGGYSLLASRPATNSRDNTVGVPAMFGVMPCLGSEWGEWYLRRIREVCVAAGLELFENDGSYPGDECASHDHPGHRGLDDSRWVQWRRMSELYQWCLANGVYTNVPDWYVLAGATKTFMGYRETNWSLPRAAQEIIERQNIYDGTWDKTSTMGWMFVPLTQYHGGGELATLEPLADHLPEYGRRLSNLLGSGVQAMWRGFRLFDSVETLGLVSGWVDFYRRHRQILDADTVHLRRADGRDLDYLLHVDPGGAEPAMLVVWNPLQTERAKTITVPLYYSGLAGTVRISVNDGPWSEGELDAAGILPVAVDLPPQSVATYLFSAG